MADYSSMGQLAKRMSVSKACVSKWVRRKDWPVGRDGPWSEDDARELDQWRSTLQPNRADPAYRGKRANTTEPPADDQDKDYWLMRKYRAQALQQEGKLLDTDVVMRAWSQTVADIRDQMLMMPPALQGLMALSDEQTRQLDDYIRRTLDGIADRMGDLGDAAESVPIDGEGDPLAPADQAEPVGGAAPLHASVDDGQPRPMEE